MLTDYSEILFSSFQIKAALSNWKIRFGLFSGKFTGNEHIHNDRSGTSGPSLFERLCQFIFQDLNHFVDLVGFCNLEVVLHRHPVNAQPAISLNGEKSEII